MDLQNNENMHAEEDTAPRDDENIIEVIFKIN